MAKGSLSMKISLTGLLVLIEIWYYFTQETLLLRPMAYVAWILFALYGLVRIITNRVYNRNTVFFLLLLLCVFGMFTSGVFSVDINSSMQVIMQSFTFFLAGIAMLLEKEERYFYKYVFLFSALFLGIIFLEFILPDMYLSIIEPLLPSDYAASRSRLRIVDGAYIGLANQTSVTEFLLHIGIAICVFKLALAGEKKMKITRFIPVILFVVGLLLTNRRGGVLVALFLLALFLFLNKRTKTTATILIVLLVLLLIYAGSDIVPGLSDILEKFNMNNEDISHGRLEIWAKIISAGGIKWFSGNGIGTFSSQLSEIIGTSSSHNSYLQLLYEMGILGTIVYVAPSVYTVFKGIKLFFRFKDDAQETHLFAEISFCLYLQLMILLFSLFEATLTDPSVLFVLAPAQLKIALISKEYSG